MKRMRIGYAVLAVALVAVLWLLVPTGAHAEKRYRADRFDVAIEVLPNGDLQVAETVAFVFEGGPFTYVFRDIPSRNSEGIYQIEVWEEGPAGERLGIEQVSVQRGNAEVKVRWEFEPTYDQVRTFTLSYVARQATRIYPDQDQVYWNAIPAEHGYEIGSSLITVQVPMPVSRIEGAGDGLTGSYEGQRATFRTGSLGEDRGVTVRVFFPHGALGDEPPSWQAAEATAQEASGWLIGLATALGLGGMAVIAYLVWSRGRDRVEPPGSVIVPPEDLPAWKAAALVQGSPAGSHVAAAIVELGQRGLLTLREVEEEKRTLFGRRTKTDYLLTLEGEPKDLSPFESLLLETLFAESVSDPPSVLMSAAMTELGREWSDLSKAIGAELDADGLVEGKRLRTGLFVAAGVLMALGIVGMILVGVGLVPSLGAAAIVIPFSLVFVGTFALIGALFVSRRTAIGAEHAVRWRAFRDYLKQVVKKDSLPVSVEWFDPYMPAVVAFGLEKGWGRRFEGVDVPPVVWFIPIYGHGGTGAVQATGALHSISTSMGGTAGGAAGGAAGAGGGGASGAG